VSIKKVISFCTSPVFLKLSDEEVTLEGSSVKLRDFQHELLKKFLNRDEKEVIIIKAPTGSGKTLSLLIPLFANIKSGWMYHGSVGVYPSRELAKDQLISVYNLLTIKLGARQVDIGDFYEELKALTEGEKEILDEYIKVLEVKLENGTPIRIVLMIITSESLNDIRSVIAKYVKGIDSNKKLLDYLKRETIGRAFRIIFTIPEYPYLLSTSAYQDFHKAGIWLYAALIELRRFLRVLESRDEKLLKKWLRELELNIDRERLFESYYVSREFVSNLTNSFIIFRAPVFFDEFHLYGGFSLASFIALLYIYLSERGVGKIVISSATPEKVILVKRKEKDLLELVKKIAELMKYKVIEISTHTSPAPKEGYVQIRKRTLVKIVFVMMGSQFSGAPAFGVIQRYVPLVLESTDWRSKYDSIGKCMILVDRVASVLEIKEAVEKLMGEKAIAICSIKKLLHESRAEEKINLREAKLIIGNMAIAFGMDIEGMDLGVIVAKDYLTVLQKIGRIGRGEGNNVAEIYLPVPYSNYKSLEKYLEMIDGKEIPYISNSSEIDFVKLLEKLYPRPAPDIIVGWWANLLRMVLPVWVYILTNIIRLRSEVREILETARKLEDVKYLHEFSLLFQELKNFIEVKDLEKKLRKYMKTGIYLTPLGLFNFYSYRNIVGIPIKKKAMCGEILEEVVDLVTAGRNIPLEYEHGEFRVKSVGKLYEYTMLRIRVEDQREQARYFLGMLDNRVVTLQHLVELLGGNAALFQEGRKVCSLPRLTDIRELQDLPILVLDIRDDKKRVRLIEYLSAVESAIPIEECRRAYGGGDVCEYLGAIYLL